MKIYYLKRILMTVITVVFFTSMFAQPANVYLIGGPVNKNNPNWLLDQKVELTKDPNNPSLFYYKGYLAYNWRGDERGNIKFLVGNTWDGSFHPNTTDNQLLTGTTSMRQDGSDTKWYIPDDRSGDGYYELTLNAQEMTLTVDSFRHDLNPEKIYAVGGSLPCGWDNSNPEVMTRTNPEVAVYTWTGTMNSGDFKFLTPLSIGNWDFCYDATTANEPVSYGVSQNLVLEVRNSSETTFNDYKFIMNETAECTITVDLVNNKMTVTKNGVLYAQDIWITGSAIPGGKAKLVSDNIDPLINYHYYGQLLAGEFKFATTENINSTTQFYTPTSSADAISTNTDVSLTSSASTSGWTVTQANDMYKIKLNTLTKKFNGSIFNVDHVYIVGGATAVGWDAGNAIELTKGTGDQSNVFTFDGALKTNVAGDDRNKFKFLLQKDWGPYSFHPQTENASITGAQFFTDHHSDDYKWTIDDDKQGRYVITLDALQETIQSTYYPVSAANLVEMNSDIKVFAANGRIQIVTDNENAKTAQVFAVDGHKVADRSFDRDVEIDLISGIYTVRVYDGTTELMTRKVIIIK
ncbi:MAG: SusF/SusE family outer membrane protein [Bacteroidota bacterium]|nr:SusF/SusE family outer membrane protein [Bacteroidota bacterium]